jgi:hypothetical protein
VLPKGFVKGQNKPTVEQIDKHWRQINNFACRFDKPVILLSGLRASHASARDKQSLWTSGNNRGKEYRFHGILLQMA